MQSQPIWRVTVLTLNHTSLRPRFASFIFLTSLGFVWFDSPARCWFLNIKLLPVTVQPLLLGQIGNPSSWKPTGALATQSIPIANQSLRWCLTFIANFCSQRIMTKTTAINPFHCCDYRENFASGPTKAFVCVCVHRSYTHIRTPCIFQQRGRPKRPQRISCLGATTVTWVTRAQFATAPNDWGLTIAINEPWVVYDDKWLMIMVDWSLSVVHSYFPVHGVSATKFQRSYPLTLIWNLPGNADMNNSSTTKPGVSCGVT